LSTPFRLLLPTQIYKALVEHARAELPNECCGYLAGRIVDGVGRVEKRYPLVNMLASPVEYTAEPKGQFAAHKDMRASGIDVLAVYHSHPTTAPIPSRTDIARLYSTEVVCVIVSLCAAEPHVRAWWLSENGYREAEFQSAQQGEARRRPMMIYWHRIFGMALTQYFAGTAWRVDVEVDLSLQQQRLDIAVLRHGAGGPEPLWPDGFGPPAPYNLLTFRALHDPLLAWTLKELVAHSVAYRKWVSPDLDHLLPEDQFRLLAASMHYPRQLASQVALLPRGPGTYDVVWGTDTIRILVLREMPEAEQNLVWNLFSGDPGRISAAFQRLQPKAHSWSSTVNALLKYYGLEGLPMPYTMEDFKRDVAEDLLNDMTPDQLLARLPIDAIEAYLKKVKEEKKKPESNRAGDHSEATVPEPGAAG
jgi:proteasome lid subunit RPN8/RPN11